MLYYVDFLYTSEILMILFRQISILHLCALKMCKGNVVFEHYPRGLPKEQWRQIIMFKGVYSKTNIKSLIVLKI